MLVFRSIPNPVSVIMVLCFVTACSPAVSGITIDAGDPPVSTVSSILYGTQITLGGDGFIDTNLGETIRYPVTFSSYLMDKLKEMKVETIRFSPENLYSFRDGIGPYDLRPGRPEGVYSEDYRRNDFGTHEFIDICRRVGAEPVLVAPLYNSRYYTSNMASGEQIAANWVEYCNGVSPGLAYGQQQGWEPTTFSRKITDYPIWKYGTKYKVGNTVARYNGVFTCKTNHTADYSNGPGLTGRNYWTPAVIEEVPKAGKSWAANQQAPKGYFAWLREYFGSKEPFNVKYWEIGNEHYATTPRKIPMSSAVYRDRALAMIQKMKAVDPTIKCGVNFIGPEVESGTKPAMEVVLGRPGNYTATYNACDFIIFHPYFPTTSPNLANPAAEYQKLFADVAAYEAATMRLMAPYPKPLMFTEYNLQYGLMNSDPSYIKHMHRLKSGLTLAAWLNACGRMGVLAAHQIYFGNKAWWDTSNTPFRMVFDDVNAQKRSRQGVTPTYLALKLYSNFAQGDVLKTTVAGDNLLAQAYRSSEGALRLFVINPSASENTRSTISLNDFSPMPLATVYTLNSSGGMEAFNDLNPNTVSISQSQINLSGSTFQYTFPAHSLTVLDLTPPDPNSPANPPAEGPAGQNPEPTSPSNPSGGNDKISVTSTASTQNPLPGETVTYMTRCVNISGETLYSAQVRFYIPAGMTYVAGSADQDGRIDSFGRKVTWTIPVLPVGGYKEFSCRVTVN